MRSERLWVSFFILLALCLNFAFFYGELNNPEHHHKLLLFFAFIVNLVATILKFGDRTQMGALLLATILVADILQLAAVLAWTFSVGFVDSSTISTVVSLSAGALLANLVAVILVIIETALLRR